MTTSKRIKIVTDSVSDLSPEEVEAWDITVIPTFVNYEGNSYADDGVELHRDEFYDLMPKLEVHPTTAAPSQGLAQEMLEKAFKDADHLVCVHLAGKLSSTIQAIKLGAENIPEDQITFIDTNTVSIGEGHLVSLAAEVARDTNDVQQIVDAVVRARDHAHVYAAIASMDSLRRSGRITSWMAQVGDLLQIKPIIEVKDGEVVPHSRVRTFKRAIKQLETIAREQGELDRLGILHIRNEAGAKDLYERLQDIAPQNTFIREASPSLGVHIGNGSLGIATLSKKWKA